MKNLFTLFELDNQKVENEWLEELIDNSTPDELMEWIELELWWVEYLSFSYRRKNWPRYEKGSGQDLLKNIFSCYKKPKSIKIVSGWRDLERNEEEVFGRLIDWLELKIYHTISGSKLLIFWHINLGKSFPIISKVSQYILKNTVYDIKNRVLVLPLVSCLFS